MLVPEQNLMAEAILIHQNILEIKTFKLKIN